MIYEVPVSKFAQESIDRVVLDHLSGKLKISDEIDVENIIMDMTDRQAEQIKGRASVMRAGEDEISAYHCTIQLSRLAPVQTPDGPFSEPSTIVSIFTKRVGHRGWEKSEFYSDRVFRGIPERRGG